MRSVGNAIVAATAIWISAWVLFGEVTVSAVLLAGVLLYPVCEVLSIFEPSIYTLLQRGTEEADGVQRPPGQQAGDIGLLVPHGEEHPAEYDDRETWQTRLDVEGIEDYGR